MLYTYRKSHLPTSINHISILRKVIIVYSNIRKLQNKYQYKFCAICEFEFANYCYFTNYIYYI